MTGIWEASPAFSQTDTKVEGSRLSYSLGAAQPTHPLSSPPHGAELHMCFLNLPLTRKERKNKNFIKIDK